MKMRRAAIAAMILRKAHVEGAHSWYLSFLSIVLLYIFYRCEKQDR